MGVLYTPSFSCGSYAYISILANLTDTHNRLSRPHQKLHSQSHFNAKITIMIQRETKTHFHPQSQFIRSKVITHTHTPSRLDTKPKLALPHHVGHHAHRLSRSSHTLADRQTHRSSHSQLITFITLAHSSTSLRNSPFPYRSHGLTPSERWPSAQAKRILLGYKCASS